MKPFSLNRIPRIVHDSGIANDAGRKLNAIAGKNRKTLLVCDPNLEQFGIVSRVKSSLADAGHEVLQFDDIKSDPGESQIQSAIELGRDFGSNAVVCLGGGSTMDAGKLIACLLNSEGQVTEHRLAAKPLPNGRPPILCMPTTAGTGSEATSVSVVSDSDGTKYWYWGPDLKADLVILDPELTANLPSTITAASGIDALVHAIEAETCKSRQDVNQRFTLEAIRLAVRHLPRVVSKVDDSNARSGMLLAATYGGISIDNAGTGIAHNIAHALGSLIPIHHGRAVAIAMAATFAWNIEGNSEIHAPVANAFGSDGVNGLAEDFANFVRQQGVKTDLERETSGLKLEDLVKRMSAPENEAMRNANVRVMTDADLPELAKLTLSFK